MDLREQYIRCCEAWIVCILYKDNEDSYKEAKNNYDRLLQEMGIENDTLFTIVYCDNSSFTSQGLKKLDKYIRKNYNDMNIRSFNKV